MVAKLLFHIGEGFLLLNEQTGIGMPQVMDTDMPQPAPVEHWIEDTGAHRRLVSQLSPLITEHPLRHLFPSSPPRLFFAGLKERPQGLLQLSAHVHTPTFAGLRRAEPLPSPAPSHLNEAPMKVNILPLEGQHFP